MEIVIYLINQETEFTKEGREWKFTLIQTIVRHPELDTLSGLVNLNVSSSTSGGSSDWITELKRVEGRGPFYKPPQMSEMMTMEH